MLKSEFERLTAKEIKELFVGEVDFDYLLWAQEDPRKTVRDIVSAYVLRQKRHLIEMQRLEKMYEYEKSFYEDGLFYVAGIDEVGRGPIAGPVTVAAVILPPLFKLPGLNDSKKLSEKKREELYDFIMAEAIAVSCVSYGPEIIDEKNIYEATRAAMYEALETLSVKAEAVLVDAMPLPKLSVPVESLVKGDSKSASIAAASIVAKVTRDRFMTEMEKEYPGYGFREHKGYFTEFHKEAVLNLGVTPLHRKSFEPIKSIVLDLKY